jgi:transcriptional regulator with GAF, ATPase, and Fis domain
MAEAGPVAADATPAADDEILTDADLRQREKANMIAALNRTGWRISGDGGAAELLGLKPSTLAYRMRVFEIEK